LAIFIILILLNFAPAFVTAADIVEVRGVEAGTTGAVEKLEVRGQVATGDTTWNTQNFAGFYYDIKNDIGTETLSTTLTDKKLSGDSPYGVKYETTAMSLARTSRRISFSGSPLMRIPCPASSSRRFLLMTIPRRRSPSAHPSGLKKAMSWLSSPLI
jgi:hypothetical protein